MKYIFRLVSHNLLEGLRPIASDVGERRHFDRVRAEAARAIVHELRPDILVLNEALFCQEYKGCIVDYSRLFGFPYQSAALYDDAWGNAILSRWPILRSHQMRTKDRGGLVAVIDMPVGELTVASYHPPPNRNPTDKAADFVRLVADLSGPLIVCGDFNCVSHEDAIESSIDDCRFPSVFARAGGDS
jgi:exodeoxyribonuclease III